MRVISVLHVLQRASQRVLQVNCAGLKDTDGRTVSSHHNILKLSINIKHWPQLSVTAFNIFDGKRQSEERPSCVAELRMHFIFDCRLRPPPTPLVTSKTTSKTTNNIAATDTSQDYSSPAYLPRLCIAQATEDSTVIMIKRANMIAGRLNRLK